MLYLTMHPCLSTVFSLSAELQRTVPAATPKTQAEAQAKYDKVITFVNTLRRALHNTFRYVQYPSRATTGWYPSGRPVSVVWFNHSYWPTARCPRGLAQP